MSEQQPYVQVPSPMVLKAVEMPTSGAQSGYVETCVISFDNVRHLMSKKPLQRPRRTGRLPR